MGLALEEAREAGERGEVPVGAVVADPRGRVIARAGNRREAERDPLGHAELLAIRAAASALDSRTLDGCTLVVTLEPCAMCAGAIVAARVPRVVFGAWDEKAGAAGSQWDLLRDRRLLHTVEVIPEVRAPEGAGLLRDFFGEKR